MLASVMVQGHLADEKKRADSAAQTAKQHLADATSELQEAWQRCDSQQDNLRQLEVGAVPVDGLKIPNAIKHPMYRTIGLWPFVCERRI